MKFLIYLAELFTKIPPKTPGRLKMILKYANDGILMSKFQHGFEIDTDVFDDSDTNEGNLMMNINSIRKFAQHAKDFTVNDVPVDVDIILLPTLMFCCGKDIKIDSRCAKMLLYCESEVKTCKSYHGKCSVCNKIHYHTFFTDANGKSRQYVDTESEYLIFTSGVGFSRKLLHNIDMQISIGVVSFDSSAEIYNNTVTTNNNDLNAERLQQAWFLYKILRFVKYFPQWPRDANSRVDMETLSKTVYGSIREEIDSKWMKHVCEEDGCKNRFIVIDGNEKNYRAICGAKRKRIEGKDGEVNTYDLCINNPIRGNQYGKASRYCSDHKPMAEHDKDDDILGPSIVSDLRPRTRAYLKSIPNIVTSGEGCKKKEDVTTYFTRTAGLFYMFRPCGIRLSHWEMYSHESLSNVFLYLIDLFGEEPAVEDILGIAYDRACDLEPFILRLAAEGNTIAKSYGDLDYLVDIFHCEGHTQAKCVLGNPNCQYHPHLEKFSHVRKMNTEVAEQSFHIINPFKYMTRKMSYGRRLLFLKFIDDNFNYRLSEKLSMR